MGKIEIKKASRASAPLKIGLIGQAGSGKTYTALLLASQLRDEPKIAVIDTESGRSEKYSHLCDFDYVPMRDSFSPNKYIEYLDELEKLGYNVIIIDSLTHAWSGPGGVLEIQDRLNSGDLNLAGSRKGDNWANWNVSKRFHKRLMDRILSSRADIIACMRAKSDYVDEVDKDGKKKKVKQGFKVEQQEDIDYEFDLVFMLQRNHSASAQKDTTELYDDHDGGVLTAKDGKTLNEWRKDAPSTWQPAQPKPDEIDEPERHSENPPVSASAEAQKAEAKATSAPKKPAAKKTAAKPESKPESKGESTVQYVLKLEQPDNASYQAVTTETHYLFIRHPGKVDDGVPVITAKIKPSLRDDGNPKQMECFDGKVRPVAEILEWETFDAPEVEAPVTDEAKEESVA